jgi:DNA adenine methylase
MKAQQLSFLEERPTGHEIVNVASVPHRSPFRYPGGKTWLVPLVRRWLMSQGRKPRLLVEPFAGGGIVGLTAAFEKLTDHVLLTELDEQVAAVWETMLSGDADWLAKRMLSFDLTLDALRVELGKVATSKRELAFQTLLRNRTAHGGILAAGAGVIKHGENGKGILSRWYPQTIARRLSEIALVANRMTFLHSDAFDVLKAHSQSTTTVFFIDPPYTVGGKSAGSRLYTHSEIDHDRLFSMCEKVKGDFLITYDNADEVMALAYKHGFQTRAVPMKNTHHAEMTELLIGRDLSWMECGGVFREQVSHKFRS